MRSAFSFCICLIVLTILLTSTQLSAARHETNQYLYTVGNETDSNRVHAYRISASGALNELELSPFATGGKGNGIPPFSANGLVLSRDGRYLYAVNHSSNDLSVFIFHTLVLMPLA